MESNNTTMNELIAKWLAGEASPEEIREINIWVAQHEDNRKYLETMQTLWDSAEDEENSKITAAGWETIQKKINKPSPLKTVYRAAMFLAACFALFIAGRMVWQKANTNDPEPQLVSTGLYIQSGNEVYTTTLPDGTAVTLQPHSIISADSMFNKTNRNIQLKGSAHFTTIHGQSQVFSVQCGQWTVRDIGTAFSVSENNKMVQVKVTEGKVQVKGQRDSAFMTKGDSAVLDRIEQKLRIIKEKAAEKVAEVKDKIIEFQKTELKKVGQTLSALYQTDIRLSNPAIENCKLTARFDNESLENVLEVIRETFNLEIKRKGNVIYLDGKGCQ